MMHMKSFEEAPNQTVAFGSDIIVQIQRPVCHSFILLSEISFSNRIQNSLTGSTAVAIGLASCPNRACQPASSIMGCHLQWAV
jgi:hypothetical protein